MNSNHTAAAAATALGLCLALMLLRSLSRARGGRRLRQVLRDIDYINREDPRGVSPRGASSGGGDEEKPEVGAKLGGEEEVKAASASSPASSSSSKLNVSSDNSKKVVEEEGEEAMAAYRVELERLARHCSREEDAVAIREMRVMPEELLYGIRMSATLDEFLRARGSQGIDPSDMVPITIACRAQHVGRWKVPRSSFPEGKQGYLTWRTSMYKFHADIVKSVMENNGFNEEIIARTRHLIMKKNIKGDNATQVLEDVACLVFLSSYFSGFLKKFNHFEDAKVVDIVRKSWAKMSPEAQSEALKLPLNEKELVIVKQALGI